IVQTLSLIWEYRVFLWNVFIRAISDKTERVTAAADRTVEKLLGNRPAYAVVPAGRHTAPTPILGIKYGRVRAGAENTGIGQTVDLSQADYITLIDLTWGGVKYTGIRVFHFKNGTLKTERGNGLQLQGALLERSNGELVIALDEGFDKLDHEIGEYLARKYYGIKDRFVDLAHQKAEEIEHSGKIKKEESTRIEVTNITDTATVIATALGLSKIKPTHPVKFAVRFILPFVLFIAFSLFLHYIPVVYATTRGIFLLALAASILYGLVSYTFAAFWGKKRALVSSLLLLAGSASLWLLSSPEKPTVPSEDVVAERADNTEDKRLGDLWEKFKAGRINEAQLRTELNQWADRNSGLTDEERATVHTILAPASDSNQVNGKASAVGSFIYAVPFLGRGGLKLTRQGVDIFRAFIKEHGLILGPPMALFSAIAYSYNPQNKNYVAYTLTVDGRPATIWVREGVFDRLATFAMRTQLAIIRHEIAHQNGAGEYGAYRAEIRPTQRRITDPKTEALTAQFRSALRQHLEENGVIDAEGNTAGDSFENIFAGQKEVAEWIQGTRRVSELACSKGKTYLLALAAWLKYKTTGTPSLIFTSGFGLVEDAFNEHKVAELMGRVDPSFKVGLVDMRDKSGKIYNADGTSRQVSMAEVYRNAHLVYSIVEDTVHTYLYENLSRTDDELALINRKWWIFLDEAHLTLLGDRLGNPFVIANMAKRYSEVLAEANVVARALFDLTGGKLESVYHKADVLAKKVTLRTLGKVFVGNQIKGSYLLKQLANAQDFVDTALSAWFCYGENVDYRHNPGAAEGEEIRNLRESGEEGKETLSHGMHQAIRAKYGYRPFVDGQTVVSVMLSGFLSDRDVVAGFSAVTGTLDAQRAEALQMECKVVVETEAPAIRAEDFIRMSEEPDLAGLASTVESIASREPVLVRVEDINWVERVRTALANIGVNVHLEAMDARTNAAQRKAIIGRAGMPGSVTIVTAVGNTGIDIKLVDEAIANGGLTVIEFGLLDSEKTEVQLMRRAARRGEPGAFIIFGSLKDRVVRLYGKENISSSMGILRRAARGNHRAQRKAKDVIQKLRDIINDAQLQQTVRRAEIEEMAALAWQRRKGLKADIVSGALIRAMAKVIGTELNASETARYQKVALDLLDTYWVEFIARSDEARHQLMNRFGYSYRDYQGMVQYPVDSQYMAEVKRYSEDFMRSTEGTAFLYMLNDAGKNLDDLDLGGGSSSGTRVKSIIGRHAKALTRVAVVALSIALTYAAYRLNFISFNMLKAGTAHGVLPQAVAKLGLLGSTTLVLIFVLTTLVSLFVNRNLVLPALAKDRSEQRWSDSTFDVNTNGHTISAFTRFLYKKAIYPIVAYANSGAALLLFGLYILDGATNIVTLATAVLFALIAFVLAVLTLLDTGFKAYDRKHRMAMPQSAFQSTTYYLGMGMAANLGVMYGLQAAGISAIGSGLIGFTVAAVALGAIFACAVVILSGRINQRLNGRANIENPAVISGILGSSALAALFAFLMDKGLSTSVSGAIYANIWPAVQMTTIVLMPISIFALIKLIVGINRARRLTEETVANDGMAFKKGVLEKLEAALNLGNLRAHGGVALHALRANVITASIVLGGSVFLARLLANRDYALQLLEGITTTSIAIAIVAVAVIGFTAIFNSKKTTMATGAVLGVGMVSGVAMAQQESSYQIQSIATITQTLGMSQTALQKNLQDPRIDLVRRLIRKNMQEEKAAQAAATAAPRTANFQAMAAKYLNQYPAQAMEFVTPQELGLGVGGKGIVTFNVTEGGQTYPVIVAPRDANDYILVERDGKLVSSTVILYQDINEARQDLLAKKITQEQYDALAPDYIAYNAKFMAIVEDAVLAVRHAGDGNNGYGFTGGVQGPKYAARRHYRETDSLADTRHFDIVQVQGRSIYFSNAVDVKPSGLANPGEVIKQAVGDRAYVSGYPDGHFHIQWGVFSGDADASCKRTDAAVEKLLPYWERFTRHMETGRSGIINRLVDGYLNFIKEGNSIGRYQASRALVRRYLQEAKKVTAGKISEADLRAAANSEEFNQWYFARANKSCRELFAAIGLSNLPFTPEQWNNWILSYGYPYTPAKMEEALVNRALFWSALKYGVGGRDIKNADDAADLLVRILTYGKGMDEQKARQAVDALAYHHLSLDVGETYTVRFTNPATNRQEKLRVTGTTNNTIEKVLREHLGAQVRIPRFVYLQRHIALKEAALNGGRAARRTNWLAALKAPFNLRAPEVMGRLRATGQLDYQARGFKLNFFASEIGQGIIDDIGGPQNLIPLGKENKDFVPYGNLRLTRGMLGWKEIVKAEPQFDNTRFTVSPYEFCQLNTLQNAQVKGLELATATVVASQPAQSQPEAQNETPAAIVATAEPVDDEPALPDTAAAAPARSRNDANEPAALAVATAESADQDDLEDADTSSEPAILKDAAKAPVQTASLESSAPQATKEKNSALEEARQEVARQQARVDDLRAQLAAAEDELRRANTGVEEPNEPEVSATQPTESEPAIIARPEEAKQSDKGEQAPAARGVTEANQGVITINPARFIVSRKHNEFFLNTSCGEQLGLKVNKDGSVDLSNYILEITFTGRGEAKLYFADNKWTYVYSKQERIVNNQPLRFDPKADLSHIYALGAKIHGDIKGVRITSARLIKRNQSSSAQTPAPEVQETQPQAPAQKLEARKGALQEEPDVTPVTPAQPPVSTMTEEDILDYFFAPAKESVKPAEATEVQPDVTSEPTVATATLEPTAFVPSAEPEEEVYNRGNETGFTYILSHESEVEDFVTVFYNGEEVVLDHGETKIIGGMKLTRDGAYVIMQLPDEDTAFKPGVMDGDNFREIPAEPFTLETTNTDEGEFMGDEVGTDTNVPAAVTSESANTAVVAEETTTEPDEINPPAIQEHPLRPSVIYFNDQPSGFSYVSEEINGADYITLYIFGDVLEVEDGQTITANGFYISRKGPMIWMRWLTEDTAFAPGYYGPDDKNFLEETDTNIEDAKPVASGTHPRFIPALMAMIAVADNLQAEETNAFDMLIFVSPQYVNNQDVLDGIEMYMEAIRKEGWNPKLIKLTPQENNFKDIDRKIEEEYSKHPLRTCVMVGEEIDTPLSADGDYEEMPSALPWSTLGGTKSYELYKGRQITSEFKHCDTFISFVYPVHSLSYEERVADLRAIFEKFSKERNKAYSEDIQVFFGQDGLSAQALKQLYKQILGKFGTVSLLQDPSLNEVEATLSKSYMLVCADGHADPSAVALGANPESVSFQAAFLKYLNVPVVFLDGCFTGGWQSAYLDNDRLDPSVSKDCFCNMIFENQYIRVMVTGLPNTTTETAYGYFNSLIHVIPEFLSGRPLADCFRGKDYYIDDVLCYGDPTTRIFVTVASSAQPSAAAVKPIRETPAISVNAKEMEALLKASLHDFLYRGRVTLNKDGKLIIAEKGIISNQAAGVLLRKAKELRGQEKFDEAFELVQQVRDRTVVLTAADKLNLFCEMGVLSHLKGNDDQAKSYLSQAMDLLSPAGEGNRQKKAEMLTLVAVSYSEAGDNKESLSLLNQAIALDDQSAAAYYQRGLIYYNSGNYPLAEKDLMTAKDLKLPADLAAKADTQLLDMMRKWAAENEFSTELTMAEQKYRYYTGVSVEEPETETTVAVAKTPEQARYEHYFGTAAETAVTQVASAAPLQPVTGAESEGMSFVCVAEKAMDWLSEGDEFADLAALAAAQPSVIAVAQQAKPAADNKVAELEAKVARLRKELAEAEADLAKAKERLAKLEALAKETSLQKTIRLRDEREALNRELADQRQQLDIYRKYHPEEQNAPVEQRIKALEDTIAAIDTELKEIEAKPAQEPAQVPVQTPAQPQAPAQMPGQPKPQVQADKEEKPAATAQPTPVVMPSAETGDIVAKINGLKQDREKKQQELAFQRDVLVVYQKNDRSPEEIAILEYKIKDLEDSIAVLDAKLYELRESAAQELEFLQNALNWHQQVLGVYEGNNRNSAEAEWVRKLIREIEAKMKLFSDILAEPDQRTMAEQEYAYWTGAAQETNTAPAKAVVTTQAATESTNTAAATFTPSAEPEEEVYNRGNETGFTYILSHESEVEDFVTVFYNGEEVV
ncbi:MAG: hypothetical protein PHG40_03240, partial [Candidatus Omnitrophica bacterium]|nr:hypothetical protein [Candidatus Omnitrophota bacterium]